MYSASKIAFIVTLQQLHLFLHCRFNHILNLKGRLLPSLCFGPPEIAVPSVRNTTNGILSNIGNVILNYVGEYWDPIKTVAIFV